MSSYQELLAQRAELDRQIAAAQRAEKAEAIAAVKKLVADFSLTAEDCGFRQTGKAAKNNKAKATVTARFRGPNGETWSGRGRTPNWLATLEGQGQSRERFRIAG
ncbi:MAG TPA: H-NS histone family protein [Azospira sp.]|nr:H-NS histone family protein [Azospira sp.]